jgi:tetratricopeptide (TPR) repeat protein
VKHDFNQLERSATRHIRNGDYKKALKIYLFMSDGDPSLDGGYLGKQIAQCYEAMKDVHAAKYWYGRALEENPVVNAQCTDARKNLGNVSIDDLIFPEDKGR